MAAAARLFHQRLQQQRACVLAAPGFEHRHAPDMAVGQQAGGADRLTVGGMRERVLAMRILVVVLQLQRHALLVHEHRFAYAARLDARLVPVADADGK